MEQFWKEFQEENNGLQFGYCWIWQQDVLFSTFCLESEDKVEQMLACEIYSAVEYAE